MPDMTRSEFIALVGGSGLLLATKVRRATCAAAGDADGRLSARQDAGTVPQRMAAFRQGLKEAGLVEGQNVAIEYHSAEDQTGCRFWSRTFFAGRLP
jgi:hypothetical protein